MPDPKEKDACVFCLGAKGGTPGNENVEAGHVACDYCSVLLFDVRAEGRREAEAMLAEIRKDPAYHANDANWQRGFDAGRAELREYRTALVKIRDAEPGYATPKKVAALTLARHPEPKAPEPVQSTQGDTP